MRAFQPGMLKGAAIALPALQVHRNLGLAVTIFGLVQLPALVPRWRPKLTSPRRRLFNLW